MTFHPRLTLSEHSRVRLSPVPIDSALVRHLYRRAGFGATPAGVAAATTGTWEDAVDGLLACLSSPDTGASDVPAPSLTPLPDVPRLAGEPVSARQALEKQLRSEAVELILWWLQRMVATSTPLREKLTLLLHGQFPTALQKVRIPSLMYRQNEIFRQLGAGGFDALAQAVARDPAMMIWLDTDTDDLSHPNENFSRELMERFTMGIGNYTEIDVRQGARAFTGWRVDRRTGGFRLDEAQHDNGVKTFLGHTGDLSGEDVVDIVTHTTASSNWVVSRMWSFLAYPVTPADPVVADLAPGYAADLDMTSLLRAIFLHPAFVSTASTGGLVKQPIEYVAGTLRALGLAATSKRLVTILTGMGQTPFDPPNVGGWGANGYWLSTAATLTRARFAAAVARVAEVAAIADSAPAARPDAVAETLGIDSFTRATAGALASASSDPRALLAVALVSPEYVAN
jgi:uncharacterized protein (DUF1800 family)